MAARRSSAKRAIPSSFLVISVRRPVRAREGGALPFGRRLATEHALGVSARRQPEQLRVLTAELRRALVADAEPDLGGAVVRAGQQPPRFLKPQLLLVLVWAERRDALETLVERRRAHP